jgi:hypothetical protein
MPAAKFWVFAQDCGWLPLWLATSQNWAKEARKTRGENTGFGSLSVPAFFYEQNSAS